MLNQSLQVLIIEDSESDYALVVRLLGKGGFAVKSERVENAGQLRAALQKQDWDVIIADYSLPQFDAPAALAILQGSGLDIPFIVVSGSIGEDLAVAMMKAGANDYLLKDKLSRLVPAVEREMREANIRCERREAEEALRQSEARFATIFRSSPLAIAITRLKDGRFLFVNPAWEKSTGYTLEEAIGHTPIEMNLWTDPNLREQIIEQIRHGNAIQGAEFKSRKKTGELNDVLISGELIELAGEACVMTMALDITERKKLEQILIEGEKLAGLGTLAAGMAHEINTPLQIITGSSENARRKLQDGQDVSSEELLRRFDNINTNAWHIAGIVRSLLDYARNPAEEVRECSLNEIVQKTLPLMEHQFKSWSNIGISLELSEQLPQVTCDANKITQVLINLLNNARDAMPNGGKITIQTQYEAARDCVTLRVKDTGKGISQEIQKKIFDPFFTTKPLGEGTGLGLSISQGILRSHGGELELEHSSEDGSVFRFSVPRSK
jgi:two-component system, cell cycle sensor histidine kinase and response regulator CckA